MGEKSFGDEAHRPAPMTTAGKMGLGRSQTSRVGEVGSRPQACSSFFSSPHDDAHLRFVNPLSALIRPSRIITLWLLLPFQNPDGSFTPGKNLYEFIKNTAYRAQSDPSPTPERYSPQEGTRGLGNRKRRRGPSVHPRWQRPIGCGVHSSRSALARCQRPGDRKFYAATCPTFPLWDYGKPPTSTSPAF